MSTIRENLLEIREKIGEAAVRSGRGVESVKLIAVSKLVSPERIIEAVAAGQRCFGENYVQEAIKKMSTISGDIVWHFIGRFQSNKANIVAGAFQQVETVDRLKLALALDRRLDELGRSLDVLIQVNIGRENQKAGVLPERVEELLVEINRTCQHLNVKGLMTIPPYIEAAEAARPFFRTMRSLSEELQEKGLFPATDHPELSMGMSGDYEVAISEGSTQVRIGTAIFGRRD